MTKEPKWQSRYRKLFERYVDSSTGEIFDREFKEQILELRKLGKKMTVDVSPDFGGNPPIYWLMLEYKFPDAMYDFLVKYILEDVIDYSLLRSGLYLVGSDETAISASYRTEREGWIDYTRGWKPNMETGDEFYNGSLEIKLVISNDATNEEIVEFVRQNSKFIQEKQKMYRRNNELEGRVRESFNRKRDLHIKDLVDSGKTHKEVAEIINKENPVITLTYNDVSKVIQRLKNDKYRFKSDI